MNGTCPLVGKTEAVGADMRIVGLDSAPPPRRYAHSMGARGSDHSPYLATTICVGLAQARSCASSRTLSA